MFINGKFTDGKSTERISVINPATEDFLDEVPRGTSEDSLDAVEAASAAFPHTISLPEFFSASCVWSLHTDVPATAASAFQPDAERPE